MKVNYSKLKDEALDLRSQGMSYSEIQKYVPVSKSSLSLWLRHIALSSEQHRRLSNKSKESRKLGSMALKKARIEKTDRIFSKSIEEMRTISSRDLWLIGIALYWSEGAKQKENNPSQRVVFSNSDPLMTKLFLKWLKECVRINEDLLTFELYLHDNHRKDSVKMIKYWSRVLDCSKRDFLRLYYKADKKSSYRKNQGVNYKGLLRIKVRKSTDLNRRISGWIRGICIQCGVV